MSIKIKYNTEYSQYTNLVVMSIDNDVSTMRCKTCGYVFKSTVQNIYNYIRCPLCEMSMPMKCIHYFITSVFKNKFNYFYKFKDIVYIDYYNEYTNMNKYTFDYIDLKKKLSINVLNQHHRYHRFKNDIVKHLFLVNNGFKIIYLCKNDILDRKFRLKLIQCKNNSEQIQFINSEYHSEYNTIKKLMNINPTIEHRIPMDSLFIQRFLTVSNLEIISTPDCNYSNHGLDTVKYGSSQNCFKGSIHFRCKTCKYAFYARLGYIINNVKGCPLCENSPNERRLYNVLISIDPDTKKEVPIQTKNDMQQRVDFYLPKYNIAIELNDRSHKNDYGRTRDLFKQETLTKLKIPVLVLWFKDIYKPGFKDKLIHEITTTHLH